MMGRLMPTPPNERQSLEAELAELPNQLAAYRQEMENGDVKKARRDRLAWHIQKREKRLAHVRAKLTTIKAVAGVTGK
jgi:hypothetical protein